MDINVSILVKWVKKQKRNGIKKIIKKNKIIKFNYNCYLES